MNLTNSRMISSVTITIVALTIFIAIQKSTFVPMNNDLRFYNTRRALALTEEMSPISTAGYKSNGPCIAILLSSREKDIDELKVTLRSLQFLSDSKEQPAPVLIFNEGDISPEHKKAIVESTNRPIAFPLVDFATFPDGFDPESQGVSSKFHVKDRSDWGYYQMIRFWVTGIWKHPALEGFSTVMRVDSDSCFTRPNTEGLPGFKHDNFVYHSQYVGSEDGKEFVEGLLDFAEEYMSKMKHYPTNPMHWQFAKNMMKTEKSLPLYNTNFEVARKSWMQHPDVRKWHEAITEQAPYGVFQHRWGDAVIRYLTAAMFSPNYRVDTSEPEGYAHKKCSKEQIDQALSGLGALIDEE